MKAPGKGLNTKRNWKRRCVEASWNVRTFHCHISMGEDGTLNLEGSDPHKPHAFCHTLKQAGISLCCISEHRWRGEGKMFIDDYVIVYSGVPVTGNKELAP